MTVARSYTAAYRTVAMSRIVLDLHGSRAQQGVDIDAFETFLEHFRAALREYFRAGQGAIARKGGRPYARDSAATAFRLVEFRTGSGLVTLEATLLDATGEDLLLDDTSEALALTTLRGLLGALDTDQRLAEPVVEALGSARRAIGDDGSFGVEITGQGQTAKVVIDETRMKRLQRPTTDQSDATIGVTGRLHMIEADPPTAVSGFAPKTASTGLAPIRITCIPS